MIIKLRNIHVRVRYYMKGFRMESEWKREHGDWKLGRVTCKLSISAANMQN